MIGSSPLTRFKRSAALASRRLALLGLKNAPARCGRPLVAGLFSTPSGIGAGARRIYQAFEAAGLQPATFDLSPVIAPDQQTTPFTPLTSEDDGAGPVVVHVNAPEAPFALCALGAKRLSGRLRIAYWAWEFETLPHAWARELQYFHECWTPSTFTAEAVRRAAPGAIVRSPGYALETETLDEAAVQAWRKRLAPNGEALVLTAFDLRSSLERKNPKAAVRAFATAFEGRRDVRLILKVTSRGWRRDLDGWVDELAAGDPRIQIIDETLSDSGMDALLFACDICLSLHRSEGFGLTPAKALIAGSEVVMTAWSGNLDFAGLEGVHCVEATLVPVIDGTGVYSSVSDRWADPDSRHAAALLKTALAMRGDGGPSRQAVISAAARTHFATGLFMEKLGEAFHKRTSPPRENSVSPNHL